MDKDFNFSRLKLIAVVFVVLMVFSSVDYCYSLNEEGLALLKLKDGVVLDPFGALSNWIHDDGDPCLWFGIECSDGKVVVLNLKDHHLGGTLGPEIGNLAHLKFIILRNNSFTGTIPEEIALLKELEVLDLGCNNFSGPLPRLPTTILFDNNELLNTHTDTHPSIQLAVSRRLLLEVTSGQPRWLSSFLRAGRLSGRKRRTHSKHSPTESPAPSPSRSLDRSKAPTTNEASVDRNLATTVVASPTASETTVVASPTASETHSSSSSSKNLMVIWVVSSVGGTVLILVLVVGIYLFRSNPMNPVTPWRTGLSGQLQKVFITGVPNLKRSELEAACEDFSNVIGSSPIGTMYKGTLSTGVEIAVASIAVKLYKDWSKNLEAQFRKKIAMLSRVNHKNFVNLLGYCEEDTPFSRMMVFEYAPNGSLFEHLHIRESEHLNWGMRLRIAMGMAYCLETMHQLDPPLPLDNLTSSSVSLSEDNAAKISDFSFLNDSIAETETSSKKLDDKPEVSLESNVYSFGVLLFELMTGRLPYSTYNGSIHDWASDYLEGVQQSIRPIVDPTLDGFDEEQLDKIVEVIRLCVKSDPKQRPTMTEVTARLKEITNLSPDGAIPKLSPLWWAELEILSSEI